MNDHTHKTHASGGFRLGDEGTALEVQLRTEARDAWIEAPADLHDSIMDRIAAEADTDFDGPDTLYFDESPQPRGRHWVAALALSGAAIAAAVIGMISLNNTTPVNTPADTDNAIVAEAPGENTDIAPTTQFGSMLAGLSDKISAFDTATPESMLIDEGKAILSDVQSLVTTVGERGRGLRRFAPQK